MGRSLASILASQPEPLRRAYLKDLSPAELEALQYRWDFWARPEQLEPPGGWGTWLLLAGRGFGKTRSGAEWIRKNVCGDTPLSAGPGAHQFIAIVAETAADARDVIVKGPAGILAVHPKAFRPTFTASTRSLEWPNGARATLYNGTEPDQLRGPSHSLAWVDELAKYQYVQETWDMLQFTMRLGTPRQLITTTPRPIKIVRELVARDGDGVHVTRGSLYDNRANLAPAFVNNILNQYAGTRLGRQEIDGEIVDDVPGALWSRAQLDATRVRAGAKVPPMVRLVVAIDPATKPKNTDNDSIAETGIIVAGVGEDGRGYVIDDRSCRLGPAEWARIAVSAYDRYEADCIVVETNNGGDMVAEVIKAVRREVPVREVWASRGKTTRAEPISALYEQGRISHIGSFPALEDQMVQFTPFGIEGDLGADRVDALVWALTHLFPQIIGRAERKTRKGVPPGRPGQNKATGY